MLLVNFFKTANSSKSAKYGNISMAVADRDTYTFQFLSVKIIGTTNVTIVESSTVQDSVVQKLFLTRWKLRIGNANIIDTYLSKRTLAIVLTS